MRYKLLFLYAFLMSAPASPALGSAHPEALDSPRFHALLALGTKYRYGGRSPETGFDCSGLVAHVFEQAWGVALPRQSKSQASVGEPVAKLQDLEPGDLVFYNTRRSRYSHVGIYVGDRRFVHAPRPGQRVRVENVDKPYWRARFNGARRLSPPWNDRNSH